MFAARRIFCSSCLRSSTAATHVARARASTFWANMCTALDRRTRCLRSPATWVAQAAHAAESSRRDRRAAHLECSLPALASAAHARRWSDAQSSLMRRRDLDRSERYLRVWCAMTCHSVSTPRRRRPSIRSMAFWRASFAVVSATYAHVLNAMLVTRLRRKPYAFAISCSRRLPSRCSKAHASSARAASRLPMRAAARVATRRCHARSRATSAQVPSARAVWRCRACASTLLTRRRCRASSAVAAAHPEKAREEYRMRWRCHTLHTSRSWRSSSPTCSFHRRNAAEQARCLPAPTARRSRRRWRLSSDAAAAHAATDAERRTLRMRATTLPLDAARAAHTPAHRRKLDRSTAASMWRRAVSAVWRIHARRCTAWLQPRRALRAAEFSTRAANLSRSSLPCCTPSFQLRQPARAWASDRRTFDRTTR
mmetsp:Transcript_27069/g.92410  ORF Transcript_27069/g.92410 Transcript_27069/m.92410 type:complete len:426 (+) Transcript_27069:1784-3061(+)